MSEQHVQKKKHRNKPKQKEKRKTKHGTAAPASLPVRCRLPTLRLTYKTLREVSVGTPCACGKVLVSEGKNGSETTIFVETSEDAGKASQKNVHESVAETASGFVIKRMTKNPHRQDAQRVEKQKRARNENVDLTDSIFSEVKIFTCKKLNLQERSNFRLHAITRAKGTRERP